MHIKRTPLPSAEWIWRMEKGDVQRWQLVGKAIREKQTVDSAVVEPQAALFACLVYSQAACKMPGAFSMPDKR